MLQQREAVEMTRFLPGAGTGTSLLLLIGHQEVILKSPAADMGDSPPHEEMWSLGYPPVICYMAIEAMAQSKSLIYPLAW